MQRRAQHVDPIKRAIARRPVRRFAEQGVGRIDDTNAARRRAGLRSRGEGPWRAACVVRHTTGRRHQYRRERVQSPIVEAISGTCERERRRSVSANIQHRRREIGDAIGGIRAGCVTPTARQFERRFERGTISFGHGREQCASHASFGERDERTASSAVVPWRALPERGGMADRLCPVRTADDDAIRSVQRGELHGLAGQLRQPRDLVLRRGIEIETGPRALRELEQPEAEAPAAFARIAANVTARFERGKQPEHRRPRQSGSGAQLRGGRRHAGGRDAVDQRERLVEGSRACDRHFGGTGLTGHRGCARLSQIMDQ